MDTGYWIDGDHIFGPQDSGQFYIRWDPAGGPGWIYGPRNGGQYWIDKASGFIYPSASGGNFRVQNGRIYGPSTPPPWMQ